MRHRDLDDWTQRQVPHLQPIVKLLDQSIRAAIPGLQFAVKWKRPYYGLPGLRWIIEIAAYDISVNVVFLGGAGFERPPPLGTTDRTRYVEVTTLDEVQRPELLKYDRGGEPHAGLEVKTSRRSDWTSHSLRRRGVVSTRRKRTGRISMPNRSAGS
ncbi:MAG: DUF1801 domain-containing protein [Acidimicrobiales bacterium]